MSATADSPIAGRARVAEAFGVSASTLKRWQSNAELAERFRLRDFVFKFGGRWATTERLAARFVDHAQSIDPREATLREVDEIRKEEASREATRIGVEGEGVDYSTPAPVRKGRKPRPLAERFWSHVERRGPDECWRWLSKKDRNGYGWFARAGRWIYAHRFVYELCIGPIPPRLTIDHVLTRGCTRTDCVNPAHLEPVTQRENVLRGVGLSAQNARKQSCPLGHAYDVVERNGQRRCRRCRNAKERDRFRRHRTAPVPVSSGATR